MEVSPEILLKEVLKTVELLGVHSTIIILQNGRGLKSLDPNAQFVLSEVSTVLQVSVEEILNNRYSKTELRLYSIAFCCYFLINDFDMSTFEVATLFNLNRSTVSKRKKIISLISPSSKGEAAKYLDTKKLLIQNIRKYKRSNRKPNH